MPETLYIEKINGPCVKNEISSFASFSNHFWYPRPVVVLNYLRNRNRGWPNCYTERAWEGQ